MTEESLKNRKKLFSLKNVYIYNCIFCILMVLVFLGSGILQTIEEMKNVSTTTLNAAKTQIEYRINQSINLLQSLAAQEQYYDASLPYIDKVKELDQINEYFGYMMINYVDKDINVMSAEGSTSLASRDYMHRLFTTGDIQITDSFIAGADGKTLNYTVAVPLYQDGKISGCLFCAIYFDEIQKLLDGAARQSGIKVTLVGSKNQMMSENHRVPYGDDYIGHIGKYQLFGTTKNKLDSDLRAEQSGSFGAIKGLDAFYASYSNIGQTDWNIIATTDFWGIYYHQFIASLPIIGVFFLLLVLLTFLSSRYMNAQRSIVDSLLQSVQMLEQKIYLDEKPDNMDFHEVLQLTSDGLIDGLTGVATRTVFINQIQSHLKKITPDLASVLCFIDLDDLKILNDTYGHEAGDIALKSIGYVLREYEKKYDGLVGRYGGDEFILLLTRLKDAVEVCTILEELVSNLRLPLKEFGENVSIHCSIGATLWQEHMELDHLISEADKALYIAKQSGKDNYKMNNNGDNQ